MSDAGYANVNRRHRPDGHPRSTRRAWPSPSPGAPGGTWATPPAQQYGFLAPPGSALTQLGVDFQPTDPTTLPQAEQTAAGKCATIVQNFSNAMQDGPLAGIATLSNDISSDVQHDPAVKQGHPGLVGLHDQERLSASPARARCSSPSFRPCMGPGLAIRQSAARLPPRPRQAQIAAAVTDANCTDSSDLAGIYFAVQASYEQQLVNANQQALTAAVHRYRAAFAKQLGQLKALLRTAKAIPFPRPQRQATR